MIVFCLLYRLEILRQQNPSDVEVAIEPEELEGLDEASIQALYNQRVAEERARNAREVCSFLLGGMNPMTSSEKCMQFVTLAFNLLDAVMLACLAEVACMLICLHAP